MKAGTIFVVLTVLFIPFLRAESFALNKDYATKEDIKMVIKLLEETKDSLNKRIDDTNKRIDDTRDSLNRKIDDTRDSLNRKIDDLRSTMLWLFGTFISIALLLFGFVIRNLWVLGSRVKAIEQAHETQRDEINFLKGLVEKLVVKG